MLIDDLAATSDAYEFYGVFNHEFKLGSTIFRALEDPSDGYRSYLGAIELVTSNGVFSKRPLANVYVMANNDGVDLIDTAGHCWLSIYTGDANDYYPYFCFNYTPSLAITFPEPTNKCPKDIYPEFFI